MAANERPLTLLQWKLLRWLSKPYFKDAHPSLTMNHGQFAFVHPSRDFTKDTFRAAAKLKARGWLDCDSYGNHRLNAAGHAAAISEPEPTWTPSRLTALQERDTDVLHSLARASSGRFAGNWTTSLHCGGHNGSHHSASLKLLVRHGLAVGRQSGSDRVITAETVDQPPRLNRRAKGSMKYQVTEKGLARLGPERTVRGAA